MINGIKPLKKLENKVPQWCNFFPLEIDLEKVSFLPTILYLPCLQLVTFQQLAFEAVSESRKNYDNFRNAYELLQAEDKIIDKSFRREFGDVSALMVDQLYKQFKRRPRSVFINDDIFFNFIDLYTLCGNFVFHRVNSNGFKKTSEK